MNENYGDNFQEKSKYHRGRLPRHQLDWEHQPAPYKVYKDALDTIQLPRPEFTEFNDKKDFWTVLINRHSTRNFSSEPLTLMQLSLLLFGMTGITRVYPQFSFRVSPSAGGLYPIEVYITSNNVVDLKKGIYHYNISDHALELIKIGDFSLDVAKACLDQKMAYKSAVNVIWTAMIERSKWKYLQRCYRYLYLDCGHIAQNFYLVAEALNLGACTIGAIYDDELNTILGIDGKEEIALYVGVVGNRIK